jgi:hypothetical protein
MVNVTGNLVVHLLKAIVIDELAKTFLQANFLSTAGVLVYRNEHRDAPLKLNESIVGLGTGMENSIHIVFPAQTGILSPYSFSMYSQFLIFF